VRTIDLMPTVLRLLDLPQPDELQGTSLLPLTSRRPPDLLLKSLSESVLPRENYGWSELSALRIGDWKYILAPEEELYDLRTDPNETKNLARQREGDAVRMHEEIHHLMQDAASTGAPIAYRQELDETAREKLRSLGYLWAPGPSSTSWMAPASSMRGVRLPRPSPDTTRCWRPTLGTSRRCSTGAMRRSTRGIMPAPPPTSRRSCRSDREARRSSSTWEAPSWEKGC
jgi:hypothetical protein